MKIRIDTKPSSNATVPVRLLVLLTTMLGLQPLATDLYLPALPQLASDLGVSTGAAQSTLSVFIAGFAMAQLFVGPMSDRFGRYPVVLGGALLYMVSSTLGVFAPTLGWLVPLRLLQALGLCCTVLCARAIVRDLYEPAPGTRVLARALGWMTSFTLLGPIVGGSLLIFFSWRATFVVLAVASALVVAATLAWLPETNRHLNPAATRPRDLLRTYLTIARSPDFRAYALIGTCSYATLFSFISGSSFVLIRVLGLTPTQYGIAFGMVTMGFLPGTLITRRLEPRLGLRRTTMIGGAIALASGITLNALAFSGVHSAWAICLPMFVMLLSHGLLQPVCMVGAIGAFPRNAGAAAALLGFVMHTTAALVGWWIGASLGDTALPMTATIGAISCVTAVSSWTLLRERGANPK